MILIHNSSFDTDSVNWHLVYSGVFTLVLLLIGILIFNRVERTFMDTV
ncbi:hypothetical protein ACFL03_07155 [Thermodesulfobacteriota bacterium]